MNFKLKVWRQKDRQTRGKLVDYDARDIPAQASLLEMLDIVNERLVLRGEPPIAFDSDCREGICGACSLSVNGEALAVSVLRKRRCPPRESARRARRSPSPGCAVRRRRSRASDRQD